MSISAANRETLERSLGHFGRGFGNPEAAAPYFDLYDPDVRIHGLGPAVDLTGARAFYDELWTALPDGEVELTHVVADDDLVGYRVTVRGTHDGPLMGVPPTGRSLSFDAAGILKFEGGRVVERWNRTDEMGLMQQLGVIPAPQGASASG